MFSHYSSILYHFAITFSSRILLSTNLISPSGSKSPQAILSKEFDMNDIFLFSHTFDIPIARSYFKEKEILIFF